MHIHRYMCMDLYTYTDIFCNPPRLRTHTQDTDTHTDIPYRSGAHAREGHGPSYASIHARAPAGYIDADRYK